MVPRSQNDNHIGDQFLIALSGNRLYMVPLCLLAIKCLRTEHQLTWAKYEITLCYKYLSPKAS